MFKEPEKGKKDINVERIEDALETGSNTVAVACPFCMVMMSDGIKTKKKNTKLKYLIWQSFWRKIYNF